MCTGHAYARNGNAHNPTPRYRWEAKLNGRRVGWDTTRKGLIEVLTIGVETNEFIV